MGRDLIVGNLREDRQTIATLVAPLNLGEEWSDAVIAAEVHTWWRKLYPEERRFLERFYGEVQSWLEKALLRKGPR